MTSPRSSGSELQHKSRPSIKICITKRYVGRRRSHIDTDIEARVDEFSSCFIDDDDDDNPFIADDRRDGINRSSGSEAKSLLSNQNGAAQKDLSAELVRSRPTDDIDFIEPINDNVSKTRVKDAVQVEILETDDGSVEKIGLHFVNRPMMRQDSVGDGVDLSLGRADPSHLTEMRKFQSEEEYHKTETKSKNTKFELPEFPVTFGWFDMVIGILAILIFFVDIGTDIKLAVHYFHREMWMYGGVTTGLIIGPSLVTCFLGLHWYIIDFKKEKKVVKELKQLGRKAYITPKYVWFLRIFFTLLQVGPVVRITEYLRCGSKLSENLTPRERKRIYRFMLYEDVDSCLLRLFESFLESAPQLMCQLIIVITLKPKEDVVGTSIRAIGLLSSWGSLAMSLASYHKSLRNSHEDKAKMTWISVPFYFIWRASEIGGRVLCLAMFASVFKLWVFGPLLFHWMLMSFWLIMQKTTFYKNPRLEKVFNIICGYVMIFCFLNLQEGTTRFRFLLFYFIFYVENFFMLAFWFRFTQDLGAWFHLWGFIFVLILFVFHIVFQLLYYLFFHPTKAIKTCLPCDRYAVHGSICSEVKTGG